MAIKFNCPHCKKPLLVKDDSLAGKKAACNGCKKIVVIPKPSATPAAPAEDVEALAAAALTEPKPDAAQAQEAATIEFECPQCGEQIKMSRDLAGKNAPCPECRRIIKVPVPKTRDPADWRKQQDHLPSGARRDTEPAPEGAWEPSRAKAVSVEALSQAGLIPKKKKPGWTRRQKITYGVGAGAAVVVAAAVGLFAWSAWAQEKQEKVVDRAVKSAEAQQDKSKEAAAEANRAAGEYYLRAGTRDGADKAKKAFAQARKLLADSKPGPERDALLADLLVSQVELGGSEEEAARGLRLRWKKADGSKGGSTESALTEIQQTLGHVVTPAGRSHALRQLTRRLIARGHADDAVALARAPRGEKPPEEADAEAVAYEGPESLAVVGLEFFRAKQTDKAAKLADEASRPYQQPPDAKLRPPLAPSAVALCLAVGKPEPQPGQAKEDKERHLLGRAVGLALKGDVAAAREVPKELPKDSPDWQFRALATIADTTGEAADLDAAVAFLDQEGKDHPVSPWLVFHLVEAAAKLGQADRALHLAERISDPGLRGRAQLEVVQLRLGTKSRADDGALADIGSELITQALAREALARHNARYDNYAAAVKSAEGWDETVRPFGLLGAVLGEQDAKGK